MAKLEIARRVVHWLFTAVTIAFVVSGLGITEFRTVESWTLGLLSKNLSFKIHIGITLPFLVLMAAHIGLVMSVNRRKAANK